MLVRSDRARDTNAPSPSFSQLRQMLDRRLSIAQKGLAEAQQHLAAGQSEDAGIVLEKVDEDLHLLRCRLSREGEMLVARPSALLHDCAN
jgi:hypothetical protein